MYGFNPAKARAVAQNLADGGMVGRFKGALGFNPEDFERVKRRAEGYKNGGMVRGPGTGTSDEVPDNVPEGAYIMPADSTQAMGAEKLRGLGAKNIPVNLSNGEFKMPPEQVHAVGVQALDQMKNATHTPASKLSRGFKPELYFANGGLVEDEKKRAPISPTNTYPQASPSAGANIYAGAGLGAPAKEPAAAAPARVPGASELYMQDRTKELREQAGSGNYAQAAGTAARTAVQGLGMYGIEMADKIATPAINAAAGFGRGLLGSDAQAAPAAAPAAAQTRTPAPAVPPATNPTDARLAAGTQAAPAGPAAPAASPPVAVPGAVMPGVFQHGKGQYSDSADGMGMAAGFTGQPSAQNMAAADNLSARGFRPGMGSAASTPGPGLGFGPGSELERLRAPTVRHSGNDWASRKALENAATSASSITNTRRFGGKGAENSPDVMAYQAAVKNDMALQGAQPGVDVAAMRENAGLQRTGMQEAGANQRADLGFKTAQQRAAIEAQRAATEGRRADGEITGLGFKLREAQQYEQLRNVLLDPNATPEQKRQAQQARQSLSGEGDKWKSVALQGGTDAQGFKTESILGAVNERTGEMKRMEQGQGGARQPPAREKLVSGQIYDTPSGRLKWNGSVFERVSS